MREPMKSRRLRHLYKYRAFNNWTLDMLVLDRLHFADPSTFNDPLDTRPSLKADLKAEQLERLLIQLAEQRITAAMQANAHAIGYKGPKTIEHIARRSRRQVLYMLDEIRYHASDTELAYPDPLKVILGRALQAELMLQYGKGIVSLAERPDCPLMWSHYGDQHKGICVGYSVPTDAAKDVHQIAYDRSRLVSAREVKAMLAGDEAARRRVDQAVLLSKASDWRYEREWRLIGERGSQSSPLELKEVVFGLRCGTSVRYAVIKALAKRPKSVKFYEITEKDGAFDLKKRLYDSDELLATFPKRSRDIPEAFRPIKGRQAKA